MKKLISGRHIIVVLAVFAVSGLGTIAFAQSGAGMQHGQYRHGQGGYHDNMGAGCRYIDNLTDEQKAAIKKEREAFYKDTMDLRRSIKSKRLELRSEMVKPDVNEKRVVQLQKELSALEADFDLKRIEHRLKMQKIDPGMCLGKGGNKDYKKTGRGYNCKM